MIKTLTARFVASVKPTRGKRSEYFDTNVPGLALRVTERGAKTWTVLYRHRGRLRRLTLGSSSALGLAAARESARDHLHDVTKGHDPATAKQQARRAETFGDLADDYIERHAKRHKSSWRDDARTLRAEVLPHWRHRAIEDITRRDVRLLVDGIAERGAPIMANRTTSLLSRVFRFALDDELIETSPAVRIPRPGREQQRQRVLTDDEIRVLWGAFDAFAKPEMRAFYQLRLLTAQRCGEVSSMRWQDVDLTGAWWTIPAPASKNKLAHRVPLSASALAILKELWVSAEDRFRQRCAAAKPGKTVPEPVYVLDGARGKRQQSEATATFLVSDFRGHDLRRTAASCMAGGGIPRLTISKILNHAERGVTAVYDRHSYDAEKRAALDWWAVKLAAIVEQQDSGKVLPFAAAR